MSSLHHSFEHDSARAHVSGQARYVDDVPELQGTLYAAPVMSPCAHGRLKSIDLAHLKAQLGVVAVITAADIPGSAWFATPAHDEPILVSDEISYRGQVLALVVATSVRQARRAASQAKLELELLPAVLDLEQALAEQSFVLPPVKLERGNAAAALARAPYRLKDRLSLGGQEHFYLEGQAAYALPQEANCWLIHSGTQHPAEVQHWVAHALGLAQHRVEVVCRRMGGAFGGKETQAGQVAVWAALAAHCCQRPVKMRLDRDEDFLITGKRHPFDYRYEVGFDASGRLCGLKLDMLVNCGFCADLSGPVADRAMFHVDNAYFLEDVAIHSWRLKTHTQSHTAFRGFGGPQGMFVIETIMGQIARHLGKDPLAVRLANLYDHHGRDTTHYQMKLEDNILAPLMERLATRSGYHERRLKLDATDAEPSVLQRGLALTPVKFGISFTATQFNQAGALVQVYSDGSVGVNHGGTEMGQGLFIKVAQVVASVLGLSVERVLPSASATSKVPNASATAASSGTDLNARAAERATLKIRQRLAEVAARLDGCDSSAVRFAANQVISPLASHRFEDIVTQAYRQRVQLFADGFYATPKIHYDKTTLSGRPFYYFAYGAAVAEVVIDTRTGEYRTLAVDILHDVGHSLNPAIDRGQIEGGFIQGQGWLTSEELVWGAEGQLLTHAPSTYKIPTGYDTPARFVVELWDQPNVEDNIGGSKAVGEPPLMLAFCVIEALRDAVQRDRHRRQLPPTRLDAPATPERVWRALNS